MPCNQLIYILNVLVIANLGVTNIINAVLYSFQLSHQTHSMCTSLHCLSKSSCNEHNRIITTVVPLLMQYASNINNKLFPSPIAIILTMGLYSVIMAYIVFSCNLRNSAFSPINSFNFLQMLTQHICLNCQNCTLRPMCSYLLYSLFMLALILTP